MPSRSFQIFENKVIIHIKDRICETSEELLASKLFEEILKKVIAELTARNSILLQVFGKKEVNDEDIKTLIETLKFLAKMRGHFIPNVVKNSEVFFKNPSLFNSFIEYIYNYWRSFDRFIICDSAGDNLDKRPYRTFNATIECLTNLVRGSYRDIQENITHKHPRIFRQVMAGAEIACICMPKEIPFISEKYENLKEIPMIRQILINPPLIIDPPMNKRSGKFEKSSKDPLKAVAFNKMDWLCYPAKVGPLVILIYFHKKFFELGFSLCNLFELADDKDLEKRPDAIFTYGMPEEDMAKVVGSATNVFFDDKKNDMLVASVSNNNSFGYFGYLKKMVLTLHNIRMMKIGKLPYHGALVKIILRGDKEATILLIGDTGAGKSETLEALRGLAKEYIQDVIIIADDMGSIEITENGDVLGYGTETGAFLRLDDLRPGYAFGQLDRAILMSPNSKENVRIVIPVTTYDEVVRGYKIDYILYANNYEEIDEEHTIVEKFDTAEQSLKVFREGMVMSKGTTTSKGIVHSYFANIFGPTQYKEIHDPLAEKYFKKFFESNIFVGQMRTRLGIAGWERKGPEEAATALLKQLLEK